MESIVFKMEFNMCVKEKHIRSLKILNHFFPSAIDRRIRSSTSSLENNDNTITSSHSSISFCLHDTVCYYISC